MQKLTQIQLTEMKIEALNRINFLKLTDEVKECFLKESLLVFDYLYNTEYGPVIEFRKITEAELKMVRDIEKQLGIMVYVVIASETSIGSLLDCLYVSSYPEDRLIEADIMHRNLAMSYCINLTDEYCSELGSIEFKNVYGRLMRIV